MTPSIQRRTYRRRRRRSLLRFWWVGLILGAVLVAWFAFFLRPTRRGPRLLEGYIYGVAPVQEEYVRYYRKKWSDANALQQLQQADALMLKHDYVGAAALLERISSVGALPIVFNNLGVLYAELNDRARCINAFREALARDSSYRPVRDNIDRLRDFTADSAEPVTREIEPNDSNGLANLMALNHPVDGVIAKGLDDVDSFRVPTPPPPRDILSIEVVNRSQELVPALRLYDSNLALTDLGRTATRPGESLLIYVAPEPNSTINLQIRGIKSTSGEYTVSVKSTHSFDVFEPNDDIFNARRIFPGQTVEANIMDSHDSDFYSFEAPRTGTVTVDITNRSATLIPALTTFAADQRNSGFGPDVRSPGASLHHTFPVQENQVYYVQVWSQGNSAGEYTLILK